MTNIQVAASAANEACEDLDLDTLLGLDKCFVEKTPEEKFMTEYTYGSNPKIINFYHWLKHNMAEFQHLNEKGLYLYKNTIHQGQATKVMVTATEYARAMTEYFLLMCHFYSFDTRRSDKAAICNMSKVIELLLELGEVKEIISKKYI